MFDKTGKFILLKVCNIRVQYKAVVLFFQINITYTNVSKASFVRIIFLFPNQLEISKTKLEKQEPRLSSSNTIVIMVLV